MEFQHQKILVMLRLKQVAERTGLSRSTIYSKLCLGSAHYDPTFPKQVRLGSGSAVRFIENEVNEWLEQCVITARSGSTKLCISSSNSVPGGKQSQGAKGLQHE